MKIPVENMTPQQIEAALALAEYSAAKDNLQKQRERYDNTEAELAIARKRLTNACPALQDVLY